MYKGYERISLSIGGFNIHMKRKGQDLLLLLVNHIIIQIDVLYFCKSFYLVHDF